MEELVIDDQHNTFLSGQSDVQFRFRFRSESSNEQSAYYGAEFEGFSFDDFLVIAEQSISTGVAALSKESVQLFPNPNNGSFTLQWGELDVEELVLYDGKGSLLKRLRSTGTHRQRFELDLSPGLYQLRIRSDEGEVLRRLMVE